jgi:hypothetical protein
MALVDVFVNVLDSLDRRTDLDVDVTVVSKSRTVNIYISFES